MTESRIIHIVDVDPSSRTDLMRRLATVGHEVRTFASFTDYVRHRVERPSCLLAGISGGEQENLAIGHATRPGEAPSAVVFVASECSIALAVVAMKAGGLDVLELPVPDVTLHAAVENAASVSATWAADHALRSRAQLLLARLTPRERSIFARILRGERNKQIAAALGSQEATVKVHRSRLMRKLETRTLAELLHVGREVEGLLLLEAPEDPPPRPTAWGPRRTGAGEDILAAHATQAKRVSGTMLRAS